MFCKFPYIFDCLLTIQIGTFKYFISEQRYIWPLIQTICKVEKGCRLKYSQRAGLFLYSSRAKSDCLKSPVQIVLSVHESPRTLHPSSFPLSRAVLYKKHLLCRFPLLNKVQHCRWTQYSAQTAAFLDALYESFVRTPHALILLLDVSVRITHARALNL